MLRGFVKTQLLLFILLVFIPLSPFPFPLSPFPFPLSPFPFLLSPNHQVLTSPPKGISTLDAWISHPNISAVILAGLPGQESGHSLVSILYGDINPSGRLPYTIAKKEDDYGALLNSSVSFDHFPEDNFTEGLYIDYRAFDKNKIDPLFELSSAP